MSQLSWKKHTLQFKLPSGTSRGVLHTKDSWFILQHRPDFTLPAIGEVSLIQGLSPDAPVEIEMALDQLCSMGLERFESEAKYQRLPALSFGLECLKSDIKAAGSKCHGAPSAFTKGEDQMRINGLIWMGDLAYMKQQIAQKVEQGFTCIKLKIGAIEFEQECSLLHWIRETYGTNLELRVDANGAFSPDEALEKLKRLSEYQLHSIEQPIAAGQFDAMTELCATSPIDIALDEELIPFGSRSLDDLKAMLEGVQPSYIILKPSLIGGLSKSQQFIQVAESLGIGWWITSALESNIGLNAIAQFTYGLAPKMPQGLGTGSLYTNNFESPLYIQGEFIGHDPSLDWNLKPLIE